MWRTCSLNTNKILIGRHYRLYPMRRLIVEISARDFNQLDPEDPDLLQNVKSMEVLHFLRSDPKEVAMILRVEFDKPDVRIEDVLHYAQIEAQLLD